MNHSVPAPRIHSTFHTPPPQIIWLFVWVPACCGTQWAALRRKIDNLHGRVIWMKLHLTASLQASERREGASAKLWGLAEATAAGAAQGEKAPAFSTSNWAFD